MSKQCEIIKDLLPLYVDKVCSKETNELVEKHLKECEDCREYYNAIQENSSIDKLDEVKSLKNFSKKLKRRKIITIIITLICTLMALILLFYVFNKKDYTMNYNEDLFTVNIQEDGTILIEVNTLNYSMCNTILEENNDGSVDVYICLYQKLMDKIQENEEFKSFNYTPKCYDNYIDENIDVNWTWKNNVGQISLKSINDVQIKNVYYVEDINDFKTILHSNETDESGFELQKIWSSD